MTVFPFQSLPDLSERQQRTLALAGVFQSAQLAHLLAYGQSCSTEQPLTEYFTASIQACLNIRPHAIENKNPLLYFQQLHHLSLGLQSLENGITQPFSPTPKSRLPQITQAKYPTTYALTLIKLAKKIYARPDFVQRIESMQQQVLKQLAFFDYDYLHPSIMGNIALCYSETASTLTPRILIKGKVEALKDQQQADRIRTALMTGLQTAHLWRQLGGSSWGFVFGKKRIITDIRSLLKLQYQQNHIQIKSSSQ